MLVSRISIPLATATSLAARSDASTCIDDGYVVKTALAEAFGHGTVRPWRLVRKSDGIYSIVGIVADQASVSPNAKSRELGIIAETSELSFTSGDEIEIDVMATPVKKIMLRDEVTGKYYKRLIADISVVRVEGERHVFVPKEGEELEAAYAEWLLQRLGSDDSGLTPLDVEVQSTSPHRQLRKVFSKGDGRHYVKTIASPCVKGRLSVRIDDPAKFEAIARQGIKKMRDVGLGSILPTTALDREAA